MIRAARALLTALPLVFAACALPPKDPFLAAQHARERDDLLRALQHYDAVPVQHLRYPDARAGAVEVEMRMRRSHELILEALVLRSQWRDREALAVLQRAREQWSRQPSLDWWIGATEQRLRIFGDRPMADGAAGAPPPAVPALETRAAGAGAVSLPPPGAVVVEPADPTPAPRPAAEPQPASEAKRLPLGQDPVARGLIGIEARLAKGELEAAANDLIELDRRHPGDVRIGHRLARMLHQRALLRYGHGDLDAAIADWVRVLELDPGADAVRGHLERARSEQQRPRT